MSVPRLGFCPDQICACNGNNCGGRGCVPLRGRKMPTRMLFKCASCRRWVPWSFGAAGDQPDVCDDCWKEST